MDELGLSQAQMGRVFSAFLLGYALFMVPGGMAADRWGTRRVLEVASWWWAAATVLQLVVGRGPLASNPVLTLAARHDRTPGGRGFRHNLRSRGIERV